MSPEEALGEAVEAVYGVTGVARAALVEWYARAEAAYFSRSSFEVGHGSLSLEPLIWQENPAVPGPPIYLRDQMTPEARAEYARELEALKQELQAMEAPNREAVERTVQCVAGAIRDVVGLAAVPAPDVHVPQTTQS
jgi:hypothetical protein